MARSVNYDHIVTAYDRRYQQNDYSGVEAALIAFVVGANRCISALTYGCMPRSALCLHESQKQASLTYDCTRRPL
jgi:hypothetical protein